MNFFDIREYFRLAYVPILQSFETGGFVTSQAAIQCGLPEGIPVAAGLYDVDSCCLASGILEFQLSVPHNRDMVHQ